MRDGVKKDLERQQQRLQNKKDLAGQIILKKELEKRDKS